MGRSWVNPIYRTRAWQATRRATLLRDAYVCQIGLPGCKGRADSADHIVELEVGGAPFDLANTQAACRPCNTAKRNMRKGREKHGLIRGTVRAW